MILLQAISLDRAYLDLLTSLCRPGVEVCDSRLGPTRDLGAVAIDLSPVSFKLLTCPGRAINPFLAIIESCWVLAGQNDLATISFAADAFQEFSDDGNTLAGAYGHRLRSSFGFDQIENAVEQLRSQPFSRRVFLMIGDSNDTRSSSLDVPCNISLMFRRRASSLDMTVINRSNDVMFGLPYDIFTFAVLHSYLANRSGVPVGRHLHLSNSLHLYERNRDLLDRTLQHEERQIVVSQEEAAAFMSELITNYHAISRLDFNAITSPHLRSALSNFRMYRNGDRAAFGGSLANDWFSKTTRNWLDRPRSSSVATVTARDLASDE
jgi:thymidylate synthase